VKRKVALKDKTLIRTQKDENVDDGSIADKNKQQKYHCRAFIFPPFLAPTGAWGIYETFPFHFSFLI
jgi:hypothetical protein